LTSIHPCHLDYDFLLLQRCDKIITVISFGAEVMDNVIRLVPQDDNAVMQGDDDAVQIGELYARARRGPIESAHCLIEAGHRLIDKQTSLAWSVAYVADGERGRAGVRVAADRITTDESRQRMVR
jgi:hypothetical protein